MAVTTCRSANYCILRHVLPFKIRGPLERRHSLTLSTLGLSTKTLS